MNKRLVNLLLTCVTLGLAAGMLWPFGQDEGVFLAVGKAMSSGALPYQSIFDHKTPGIYFIIDFFSKLGIDNIFFYRFLMVAISCLTAYAIFICAKLLWRERPAIYGALFFLVLTIFFEGNLILAEQFVGLCLILSLLFMLKAQKENNYFAILGGIFLAISVIFKQTALLSVLLFCGYLLWAKFENKKKILLFLGLGMLMVTTGFIFWLRNNNLLGIFWQDAVLLNRNYQSFFTINLFLKLVIALIATAPVWFLSGRFIKQFFNGKKYLGLEMLILLIIFLNLPTLLFRPYLHYWLAVTPFIALVAGNYYTQLQKNKTSWMFLDLYLIATCIIFIFISVIIKYPILKTQIEVKKYIQNNTNINEKIYASRFYSWIYFISNRTSASKYLYINEVNEGLGAKESVIGDLKKSRPEYILWFSDTRTFHDPYVKSIGQYIRENYRIEKTYHNLDLILYAPSRF